MAFAFLLLNFIYLNPQVFLFVFFFNLFFLMLFSPPILLRSESECAAGCTESQTPTTDCILFAEGYCSSSLPQFLRSLLDFSVNVWCSMSLQSAFIFKVHNIACLLQQTCEFYHLRGRPCQTNS